MRYSSIEQELCTKGRLTYTSKGVSMWPLIRQGKDLVVIEPQKSRLKKYDVALYKMKSDSHRYILHRVIAVMGNRYIIRGDNCIRKEYGITDEMIVGVMTGLFRDGKKVALNSFRYRAYVRIWSALFPLRYVVHMVRDVAAKILRFL